MATDRILSQFVINKVENKEVYKYLEDNNLINDDELYIVEGDGSVDGGSDVTFIPITTEGIKIGEITIDGETKELFAPDGAKYTAGNGINISNENVISSTVDYSDELALKADLNNPAFTGVPTAPTADIGTNNTQIATTGFVATAVADIVNSAPETLDTLNELAAALGDDPNFATTVATQIGKKVDKIEGKGLSTNDYTTIEKEKLASVAEGATKVTSPADIGAAPDSVVEIIDSHEESINGERYTIDDTVAYTKNVPEDVLTHAEVAEVGGMTRKCMNLLDPMAFAGTNFTVEKNSDGTFTITNKVSVAASTGTVLSGKLPAGTYTIKNDSSKVLYVMFSSADYTNGISSGQFKTFEYDGSSMLKLLFVDFAANETAVLKIMLNEGTEPLPYEPYFEGLRSAPVTEIEGVGVNLFDLNDFANENGFNAQPDGTYRFSSIVRTMWRNTGKKSGRMYLSYEGRAESGQPLIFQFFYTDGTSQYGGNISIQADNNKYTFVTSDYRTVDYIQWGYAVGGVFYVKNMMLSFVDADYIPYQRHTLPIPEAVRAIDGYGWGINADCYNYIDWKNKRFVKRVGAVDIGTLIWYKMSGYENCFYAYVPEKKPGDANFLITKYKTEAGLSDGTIIGHGGMNIIHISDAKYTDAESFKVSLAGVMLYYELATPIITDISDILPPDNYLPIESNGTITAINQHGYAVPSKIIYENNVLNNRAGLFEIEKLLLEDANKTLTDNTIKSIKNVPENVLPCAEVTKLGGITRKCTNLIPFPYTYGGAGTVREIEGITWTVLNDGKIHAKGTATKQSFFNLSNGIEWASATILSPPATVNGKTFAGGACYDNNNKILYVSVPQGKTVDTVFAPTINPGDTVLPYEPYFEGLRSALVTEMESAGKNLTTAQAVYKGASRYLETVVDGRNCIRMTSGITVKNTPFVFKENTQYTVAFDTKSENYDGATTNNAVFTYFYSDGTYTTTTVYKDSTLWERVTFTSAAGKTVIAIGANVTEYRVYNYIDIDTFMLNEGTTALPYTPYFHDTLPIPEAVRALDGYGWGINADCYNYIDWKKKQFVKRVEKLVIDGTTANRKIHSVNQHSSGMYYWNLYLNPKGIISSPLSCICNSLETYKSSDNTRKPGTLFLDNINGASTIVVYPLNQEYNTVELANTYLAEHYANGNPVTVYYELAEPIITDISNILPADNYLYIENGGTIAAVNEFGYDVPNEIIYENNLLDNHASTFEVEKLKNNIDDVDNNTIQSITQDSSDGHKLKIRTGGGKETTITIPDNNTTYTFNGAVSTIKDSNLTASRALISNSSGKVAVSDVTSTELGYLDGVTSNIQTQLNGKAASYEWTATVKGQTWSRICYIEPENIIGGSFILSIGFTRNSVVGQSTFLITVSHSGANYCNIVQLSSNDYSSFKIRGVCSQRPYCYIELLDNNNGITASTSQEVHCRLMPFFPGVFTQYTSFTTGATIPSGYIAYEHTVVLNGAVVAKTFVGKLTGNADTATKATQDSSGNVITSTYATKSELNGKLSTSGGSMTGEINFITPTATGGHARGINYYNSDTTTQFGSFGALGNSGTLYGFYIGFGTSPWKSSSGLFLTPDSIAWKDKELIHAGNIGSQSVASATNATNVYSTASTSKAYILGTTATGSSNKATVYNASVYTSGNVLYGAAWNDYAEYREGTNTFEPGRVVCENGDDTLSLATERLQPGAEIVSDTFGFAIGETEKCKTPIAVSGRVLAYPYEDRDSYKPGDAVCAAPGGTVSKMTREEIKEYPERIIGTVSAIPEYQTWGEGNVPINGRIWIKVK